MEEKQRKREEWEGGEMKQKGKGVFILWVDQLNL